MRNVLGCRRWKTISSSLNQRGIRFLSRSWGTGSSRVVQQLDMTGDPRVVSVTLWVSPLCSQGGGSRAKCPVLTTPHSKQELGWWGWGWGRGQVCFFTSHGGQYLHGEAPRRLHTFHWPEQGKAPTSRPSLTYLLRDSRFFGLILNITRVLLARKKTANGLGVGNE